MKLPKEFSLAEIATVVGGRVEGDSTVKVQSVAISPLQAKPGDLALVFESKLVSHINECQASAVVVPEGVNTKLPKIVVERPLLAMQRMLKAVQPKRYMPEVGIHSTAIIDPKAELAEGVAIGPLVVIGPGTKIGKGTVIMAGCVIGGQVTIGENCLFHPRCVVADYVKIGNRVILQQGASLGADGFGYVTEKPSNFEKRKAGGTDLSDESNPHIKIPQIGTVIIEDDVEIGSNTTIDRATMGATVVGCGTKIDNLVMIAHNCRIGKESIIVSQTGVSGSATIGDRVILAGQAGIVDHIRIGNDAIIQGKAGVMKDVEERGVVCGYPAVPAREFMTNVAMTRKAADIYSQLKALQKKVAELETKLQDRTLTSAK